MGEYTGLEAEGVAAEVGAWFVVVIIVGEGGFCGNVSDCILSVPARREGW